MRHTHLETLLARRRELSIEEEARLSQHLAQCESCRLKAASYARHDAALHPLSRRRPIDSVQRQVLSRIDHSGMIPTTHRPPRSIRVGMAPMVIAILVVALSIATYMRIAGVTLPGQRGRAAVTQTASSCRGPGWVVAGKCGVVASLDQYRRPGTIVLHRSMALVVQNLENPTYIVHSDRGLPITFTRDGQDVYFSEVAMNPTTHTALYAIGRRAD